MWENTDQKYSEYWHFSHSEQSFSPVFLKMLDRKFDMQILDKALMHLSSGVSRTFLNI